MKPAARLVSLFTVSAAVAAGGEVAMLTPTEAAARVAQGKAVLIDVREPDEWADTGVAAPAVLLPLSDFEGGQKLWKPFLEQNAGKDLILYCRSGARSGRVAQKLAEQGKSVSNAGGFREWQAADLPVRKP